MNAEIVNMRRHLRVEACIGGRQMLNADIFQEEKLNYLDYLKKALSGTSSVGSETKDARTALEETLNAMGSTTVEKTELPDVSYDRATYEAPTDEEIASLAEANLTDYKQQNETAINAEAESGTKAKNEAIEAEKKAAETSAAEIETQYASAVTDFENDALKRGLARSSIAVNNSAALREASAEANSAVIEKLNGNIANIESEIAQLEASRETALNNFNIAYAAKLTETISELAASRDAKQKEVLEYNNSLTEKELKAAYDKAKLESELYNNALSAAEKEKNLADSVSSTVYKAKYEAIETYLGTLSAADAKAAILSDSLIRDSLSDYYYYKVYNDYVAGK